MQQIAGKTEAKRRSAAGDSIFQRRYVLPFLLACVILSCNTATGINSIIGFNTNITIQSGLTDVMAHWGYVLFTFLNFLFTILGMELVDRKGRKFLFLVGTSGIIVSMIVAGSSFHATERNRSDIASALQREVTPDQGLSFRFNDAIFRSTDLSNTPKSLTIIYSYGDFAGSTTPARTGDSIQHRTH